MTEFVSDQPRLLNKDFWRLFRKDVIGIGSALDSENETLRRLLTDSRFDATRLDCFADDELEWMTARTRRGKPVRVYRTAVQGHLAGFRFHTNLEHALREAEQMVLPQLLTGEVNVDRIMLRIQRGGAKVVIAFPEKVKALKVETLRKEIAA
jgi:hypothetical protein